MNPVSLLPALRSAAACCEAIASALVTGDRQAKADHSPVTIADFAAQALILRALADLTPEIPAVAEEGIASLRDAPALVARIASFTSAFDPDLNETTLLEWIGRGGHAGGPGRFWALDPIDGTKGYLRGGQYAIALGLVEDGRPVLGLLACPRYPGGATIFAGGRGLSACEWVGENAEPRPIRVSVPEDLTLARMCESVDGSHTSHERSGAVARSLGLVPPPLRMDSQAKYAAVARGEAHIYLRLPQQRGFRESVWDHAAGTALLEAAGGRVTDLNGHELDFSRGRTLACNRGVLGTNGALHEAALRAVWDNTPEESRWQ